MAIFNRNLGNTENDAEEEVVEGEVVVSRLRGGKGLRNLLILVVVVILFIWGLSEFNLIPLQLIPRSAEYQAVFLTNGQVYFGKLYREGHQIEVLKDIYYLQVTQAPQPIREGETPPSNINLVKLGGELHDPTDEMRINRDQVLFVEDLKADSKVIAAINQLKATGK